ncbi:hypothetical protein LOS78_01740 [Paracoccus sp. MA]|uniref:hypothetical protein n=1 Tax=Paracoccus sp. MA TaxID=2895796 RepID=UPI001E484E2C|nr:hypothetical protein [Paracoccus sp. MA]UFM64221.1 hypothetical protein LOS78_01740 [Paracoccus sp. MA]
MTALRVLIACECSGIVRRAFADLGHDAWSCDLMPAEDRSNRHIVGDVRDLLHDGWDLLAVMHPPCTRLANSGVRWLSEPPKNPPDEATDFEKARWSSMTREMKLAVMWRLLDEGAELFSVCWNAPIPRVAVENPVMHKHAKVRIRGYQPFAQSVQPWQFGCDEAGPDNVKKRTCLWLRGLPKLKPTGTLDGSTARDEIHRAAPGPNRKADRSRFFPGLAAAMAAQWGGYAAERMAA